jgi:hypothetical protein
MLVIYAITAIIGTVVTSILVGSASHQSTLSLLVWGILGANIAALIVAMLRLLLSQISIAPASLDSSFEAHNDYAPDRARAT